LLRCALPPAFSIVPRSRKFGLPVALPAFSFTLPFASLSPPLILSFVLDFIETKSRGINAWVVIGLNRRAIGTRTEQPAEVPSRRSLWFGENQSYRPPRWPP